MKTIGVITNTTWNIYNFRLGLICHLIEEGNKVIVIAPPDKFVKNIETLGIKFIPLTKLTRKGTNPIKDCQLVYEIHQILKKENIDILLSYTIKPNIYASIATYFTKTKCICSVTGLGYTFLNQGFASWISKKLYRIAFNKASIIAFQNQDDKALFEQLYLVKQEKTQIIPGSGINTDYFLPQNFKKTDNIFSFLFIGRLLIDKGIQEFVEAANIVSQKYSNTIFEILGELDKQNPAAISEEQLNFWLENPKIKYKGFTKDTRSFIAKCDVVVLPSYREGLPRVMLETLSMAKPAITADTAGCRDTVIDNYNGYLVQIKNSNDLANGMEKILNLSDYERYEMGQNGRKLALEKFDEKIIIQKYIEIINSI